MTSKHEPGCLRRKQQPPLRVLCSCGITDEELEAARRSRSTLDSDKQDVQWCSVCKTYHAGAGIKTDRGSVVLPCPLIPADDPRNRP